jgi:hypothetical protein
MLSWVKQLARNDFPATKPRTARLKAGVTRGLGLSKYHLGLTPFSIS